MNPKLKLYSLMAIHDDNGDTLHNLPPRRYIEKFSNLLVEDILKVMKEELNDTNGARQKENLSYKVRKYLGML